MKQQVLVVCPGRGTYTAAELGYLRRFRPRLDAFISNVDRYRAAHGATTVSELDAAPRFSNAQHATAESAPALIYTCALADFQSLDPAQCEVACIVGNSMGWYLALAAAGALSPEAAIHVVSTMGKLTDEGHIGGQIIYPVVDDAWHHDAQREALVCDAMRATNAEAGAQVFDSIHLGGFRVIAGNDEGIRSLMKRLPNIDERYPMKLVNHVAFHTPLLRGASDKALATLGQQQLFTTPRIPLVDGEGKVWQPWATDLDALTQYTLGRQVFAPYDFTLSLKIAIREFAPDKIVLLGPGSTLGGAIGQTLVDMKWRGIGSKDDFIALQAETPYLLALGRQEQRALTLA